MPSVNLLPWREQVRKNQQQRYLILLTLVVLVSLLIIYIINQIYQAQLDYQQQRNHYLQEKIIVLDQQINEVAKIKQTHQSLELRMRLIEQLQTSRNLGTQIFNEITPIIPLGVVINEMNREDKQITLIGQSESNNYLSNMLRDIKQSALFERSDLQLIEVPQIKESTQKRASTPNNHASLSNFFIHLWLDQPAVVLDEEVNNGTQP